MANVLHDGMLRPASLVDSSMQRTDWAQLLTQLATSSLPAVTAAGTTHAPPPHSLGWRNYLQDLYGKLPSDRTLPRPGDLDMLWRWPINSSRRNRGGDGDGSRVVLPPRCPSVWDDPYLGRVVHAPGEAVWLARRPPFKAVANASWTEVTHCGGGWNERHAHWMYVSRGSGLYVHVGRTISFDTHEAAVHHFLGHGCSGEPWCHYGNCLQQCNDELAPMSLAARAAGFDSVQFVAHCDMRCNLCGHELVLGGMSGTHPCSPNITYRQGLGATSPCRCQPSAVRTSERGRCASCAEERPSDVFLRNHRRYASGPQAATSAAKSVTLSQRLVHLSEHQGRRVERHTHDDMTGITGRKKVGQTA